MRHIVRRLLAGGALAGLLLSGAVAGEQTASASTTPVVYGTVIGFGWSDAAVKPGTVRFGQGGSPYFTNLRWSSWNSSSAWGTGKLWTQTPGCSPSYKCPYYSRWVGVYLSQVRVRGRARYYDKMSVEFWYAGKWRWDNGWYWYWGGSVPIWGFPLVWPYL